MLLFWSIEKKNNRRIKGKPFKTENGEVMVLSKCGVCDRKKSKFIKEQEARGFLTKLTRIKVPILTDLPIANILF